MSRDDAAFPYWLPYLHFGYLPPRLPVLPINSPVEIHEADYSFANEARHGGMLLAQIIQEQISPSKLHVIPLSGGLDSRALLSAALEAGVRIQGVTFGVPGAMDYEYGTLVANATGISHESLNLNFFPPDTESLVSAVKAGGHWTYTFDAYYNRLITQKFGYGAIVLSGFMGDTIAGSHLRSELLTPDSAIKVFMKNERFTRAFDLTPDSYNIREFLPSLSWFEGSKVFSFYETLDFAVRQVGAIYPIVIDERFDVRTPFTDPRWIMFMASQPEERRKACVLYEAALRIRWPRWFSLPTKNHEGLGLLPSWQYTLRKKIDKLLHRVIVGKGLGDQSRALRMLNYIDFASAFSSGGSLHSVARENLADLKSRKVLDWIDPEEVIKKHCRGSVDLSREIQVLVGLEINLKAACE